MRAAINNVEAGDGQGHRTLVASQLGNVLVQRNALCLSSGLAYSHGDTKNRICAEFAFVGRAIKLAHLVVEPGLVLDTGAFQCCCEDVVH